MKNRDVYLGASNWMAPSWPGRLYPEGLPDDWQLAYFNTQFDCVWLPYAVWSRLEPGVAQSWLDDTRDDFRFILESGLATPASALLTELAPKLAACIEADHPDLLWFDARTDLRALSGVLASSASGQIYLLSRDDDMATIERVRTLLGLLGLGGGAGVG